MNRTNRFPQCFRIAAYGLIIPYFTVSAKADAASCALAQAANTRYLLALDLSPRSPRHRAALLEQVGLLQERVGNYRIALDHLSERERLPFSDPEMELGHRLVRARCLFHSDDFKGAAKSAAAALVLLGRHFPQFLEADAELLRLAAGAKVD